MRPAIWIGPEVEYVTITDAKIVGHREEAALSSPEETLEEYARAWGLKPGRNCAPGSVGSIIVLARQATVLARRAYVAMQDAIKCDPPQVFDGDDYHETLLKLQEFLDGEGK